MFGKKHSEETKKKMSFSRIGIGNGMYGKKHSKETLRKIGLSSKERVGLKNGMFNKKHSDEAKQKISIAAIGRIVSEETRRKLSFVRMGRKHSKEAKRKMSLLRIGNNNPAWLGGKSFEPYGLDWTISLRKAIRQRDNYICRLCNKKQTNRKFPVHHIDYNKENNDPKNLITLCHICHTKTNGSRVKWTKFFNKLVRVNFKIIKGVIFNG